MTMIPHTRMGGALGLLGLMVSATLASAEEPTALALVYSGPVATVFMARQADGPRPVPTEPVEVTHWTFFDPADRLTSAWGWNTRVSRDRIDCQTGQSASLSHRVYKNDAFIEESTPPYRMRRPTGEDHQAILAHVCDPQPAAPAVVVESVSAARAWSDAAYLSMKAQARNEH